MRLFIWSALGALVLLPCYRAPGCINDSKTLSAEKRQHPTLAQAILNPKIEKPDVKELNDRIQKLNASPKTNDPAWWNDLAGAYLRLGQPLEAVKILEPITNRFAGDYGIHANLGTAYHLLGRYADAERQIRRDLEINPEGHGGLEKYHLALLQYLNQSGGYRIRHLYVDEFTRAFLTSVPTVRPLSDSEIEQLKTNRPRSMWDNVDSETLETVRQVTNGVLGYAGVSDLYYQGLDDQPPEYLQKWNLGRDAKLDEGVIYMATLNQKEPACQVMLGMIALRHWDINLTRVAFAKAIELGSPQAPILRKHLEYLNRFHPKSFDWAILLPMSGFFLLIFVGLILAFRAFNRHLNTRIELPKPAVS